MYFFSTSNNNKKWRIWHENGNTSVRLGLQFISSLLPSSLWRNPLTPPSIMHFRASACSFAVVTLSQRVSWDTRVRGSAWSAEDVHSLRPDGSSGEALCLSQAEFMMFLCIWFFNEKKPKQFSDKTTSFRFLKSKSSLLMTKVLEQSTFCALYILEYVCDCKPPFCTDEHWICPPLGYPLEPLI